MQGVLQRATAKMTLDSVPSSMEADLAHLRRAFWPCGAQPSSPYCESDTIKSCNSASESNSPSTGNQELSPIMSSKHEIRKVYQPRPPCRKVTESMSRKRPETARCQYSPGQTSNLSSLSSNSSSENHFAQPQRNKKPKGRPQSAHCSNRIMVRSNNITSSAQQKRPHPSSAIHGRHNMTAKKSGYPHSTPHHQYSKSFERPKSLKREADLSSETRRRSREPSTRGSNIHEQQRNELDEFLEQAERALHESTGTNAAVDLAHRRSINSRLHTKLSEVNDKTMDDLRNDLKFAMRVDVGQKTPRRRPRSAHPWRTTASAQWKELEAVAGGKISSRMYWKHGELDDHKHYQVKFPSTGQQGRHDQAQQVGIKNQNRKEQADADKSYVEVDRDRPTRAVVQSKISQTVEQTSPSPHCRKETHEEPELVDELRRIFASATRTNVKT